MTDFLKIAKSIVVHFAHICAYGVETVKPPFESVTGHSQNTHISGRESLKGVLCKYLHSINSQLYVIVSDFFIYEISYST